MKVRMRLIREWLMVARFVLRRMRFLACGVFAILSSSSMKNGAAQKGSHRSGGSPTRNALQGQR
jgi:hypothetical protein